MKIRLRPHSLTPLSGFLIGAGTGMFATMAVTLPDSPQALKSFGLGMLAGAAVLAIIIMGLLIVSFSKKDPSEGLDQ